MASPCALYQIQTSTYVHQRSLGSVRHGSWGLRHRGWVKLKKSLY